MSTESSCPVCGETLPQHKQYCPSYIQSQMNGSSNGGLKPPFSFGTSNGHNLAAEKPTDPADSEEVYKVLRVKCPKCKQMPGFPCMFKRIKNDVVVSEVDLFAVHIARIELYEVFKLGSVNEMGLSKNQIITGRGKE